MAKSLRIPNTAFACTFRTKRILISTNPREWAVTHPEGVVRASGYPEASIDFGFPDVRNEMTSINGRIIDRSGSPPAVPGMSEHARALLEGMAGMHQHFFEGAWVSIIG